jgi:transcriptional regulator with XRE-family HTH domain
METIGERIKNLRKQKKLNQEDLRKIIDVSQRTMSMIENNESDLSVKDIEKLSKFFEVSISYLIKGEEEENTISTTEQEIIQLVRNDLDIKKTLVNLLETKKKAIQQIMTAKNHKFMTA